ncbi:uncharacterized protein LOC106873026 [Octopus bimaculoides]|uniref:Uncharacterized protein n=1 Tax=Octopus bimaculoides TaxID=37653 RepID=A0A0L8H3M9_OCTBM|nr:uncharacterized protein LOC106873026 [Octopus bimaculoides]XP_014775715.1 uncharacterized protein LOC106873026 [Octopus bimaculoides]|eukprot:XP_014775714.1 PREDICTED: uncharacterized protein LOC106873026 [Octopus bimaculoides]
MNFQTTPDHERTYSTDASQSHMLHFHARLITYIGATISVGLCIITLCVLIWYIRKQKSVTFEQVPVEDGNTNEGKSNTKNVYDDFQYLRCKNNENTQHNDNRMQQTSVVYETPTIEKEHVTLRGNTTDEDANIYGNTLQHQRLERQPKSEIYMNMDTNR